MSRTLIEIEKCVDCGACTGVCPSNALILENNSKALIFVDENCNNCGLCIEACPSRAIKKV